MPCKRNNFPTVCTFLLSLQLFAVSFEWPRYSDGWSPQHNPDINALTKLLQHEVHFDGCAYGLRSLRFPQLFLKKPFRIQTSHPALVSMARLCDGTHKHDVTRGKSATASGLYTARLVSSLARLLSLPVCKPTRSAYTVARRNPTAASVPCMPVIADTLPADRIRRRAPPPEEQAPAPAEQRREQIREERALQAGVKQLHINLGHPSNSALARAIRVTGGSDRAVEAALNLQCDTCEALRTPEPNLPGRLRGE